VWGVVDRVVDVGPALLDLGVDRVHIVDADVRVPHHVDDLPMRHQALGLI
jgi:hypothetical protein